MPNYYVNENGQVVAANDPRGFLTKLTDGLTAGSAEWFNPGQYAQSRNQQNQLITSALNQQGLQSRDFAHADKSQQRGFEFTGGQNAIDRSFRTTERLGGQQFQSGENELNRRFQSGESAEDRAQRERMQQAGFGHDIRKIGLDYDVTSALKDQEATNAMKVQQFGYENNPLMKSRSGLYDAQAALAEFKAKPEAPLTKEQIEFVISGMDPESAAKAIQRAQVLISQNVPVTYKDLNALDKLSSNTRVSIGSLLNGGTPAPSTNAPARIKMTP